MADSRRTSGRAKAADDKPDDQPMKGTGANPRADDKTAAKTSDMGDQGVTQNLEHDAAAAAGLGDQVEQAQDVAERASMGRTEAKRAADTPEGRRAASGVCVVSDGTPHTGHALPGKLICSAHEMHYFPNGTPRRKVHAAAQKVAERPDVQVPLAEREPGEPTPGDRARAAESKGR